MEQTVLVKYSPENGQEQTWTYVPAKVRQSEAEMAEKRSGMTWDEFNKNLLSGNARARKVLLWMMLRRDHPVFRYEDTPDFCMAEVQVSFERSELVTIRQAAEKSSDMDETTKVSALAALDDELAKLEAVDDEGKASSNPSGNASGL